MVHAVWQPHTLQRGECRPLQVLGLQTFAQVAAAIAVGIRIAATLPWVGTPSRAAYNTVAGGFALCLACAHSRLQAGDLAICPACTHSLLHPGVHGLRQRGACARRFWGRFCDQRISNAAPRTSDRQGRSYSDHPHQLQEFSSIHTARCGNRWREIRLARRLIVDEDVAISCQVPTDR